MENSPTRAVLTAGQAMSLAGSLRLHAWWKPKAANLLAVLYSVILAARLPFARSTLLLGAVVTIVGIGGFGHVVNDLCDIPSDAAAGKPNVLAMLPRWKRLVLLVALLCIALLPWVVLPLNGLSIALLLAEFALFSAYAVPPLRLKQRGFWAVLTDAGYAYALPALLAANTFFLAAARPVDTVFLLLLFIWQMALGVRHFLNHLALDRAMDQRSGIATFATRKGNRYIHTLIRRTILPIELLGFAGYLLVMSECARFLAFVVTGVFLVLCSLHAVLAVGRSYPFLTYRFSKTQLDWFYQVVLPLVLLSYLVVRDARFFVVLFAHVLLFALSGKASTASLSPEADLDTIAPSNELSRPTPLPLHQPVTWIPDLTGRRRLPAKLNIAIANINKGKYTETFVQGLVSRLHYTVYYLYGNELPCYDNEDRHFLSARPTLHALADFLEVVLGLEKDTFLRSSICSYLQAKDITVVLAEFGPVGIHLAPIARDLGIPLVVYFHGYDVFHRKALEQYSSEYPALFRDAACIIGVSETMLDRLEQLGAPREKLVHVPAFVDLDLFSYSDHRQRPPHFLAVGRFAETKSPHLTLLAFHEVIRFVPEATLTLVGKGGGGELFEACLILARALRVEDRVEFKGVLSHEEVAAEMRRARVFVQHSVTTPEHGDQEGKPVAVMEAMACGLPVVATRHSGIAELIEDGVTGLLVGEYDIAATSAAMVCLAHDDGLVHELGVRASAFIRNHPLISRHVEIIENIIARAAGN